MVASAAGALRGWQEGGRESRPEEGQLLPGLCCGIRGCRVRRVAARVETRERSSDPLARYRATHSRVRRRPLRSGAQHAQPVVRLYPQSLPCLFLSFSAFPTLLFSLARLSFLFLLQSYSPSSLSRFLSRLSNASLYLQPKFFVLFFCFYVSLFLSVRPLSFTFSFSYRTFYSLRCCSLSLSQVQGWRARPATPRFVV